MTARVLLGMQGWDHAAWVGSLYTPGTVRSSMLREYSAEFRTVEVHDTFGGIPPEPLVKQWRDTVPVGFAFALKVPQQVTHERRFTHAGQMLGRFVDRCTLLGQKLGPMLLLAPVDFAPSEEHRTTLREFLRSLPSGFEWALEMRHKGWLTEEFLDLLAGLGVALVLADSRWMRRATVLDLASRPTAGFCYVRWNSRAALDRPSGGQEERDDVFSSWAGAVERMSSLASTVYGYFNKDFAGDGMRSMREMRRRLAGNHLEGAAPRHLESVERSSRS